MCIRNVLIVDLLSPLGEDAVDALGLAVILRFHLETNRTNHRAF